jgi:hypothetical protein
VGGRLLYMHAGFTGWKSSVLKWMVGWLDVCWFYELFRVAHMYCLLLNQKAGAIYLSRQLRGRIQLPALYHGLTYCSSKLGGIGRKKRTKGTKSSVPSHIPVEFKLGSQPNYSTCTIQQLLRYMYGKVRRDLQVHC